MKRKYNMCVMIFINENVGCSFLCFIIIYYNVYLGRSQLEKKNYLKVKKIIYRAQVKINCRYTKINFSIKNIVNLQLQ